MKTGDEARAARTSVQERVKRGAARNLSLMGGVVTFALGGLVGVAALGM
jgi:hypothetical protein